MIKHMVRIESCMRYCDICSKPVSFLVSFSFFHTKTTYLSTLPYDQRILAIVYQHTPLHCTQQQNGVVYIPYERSLEYSVVGLPAIVVVVLVVVQRRSSAQIDEAAIEMRKVQIP